VRLNRRGLGTGLLWSRILPSALLLATAGVAILCLGSGVRQTSANPVAQLSALGLLFAGTNSSHPVLTAYGHLPLMFEPNQGQTDPRVQFLARGGGYGLFLTGDEAVLSLGHSASGNKLSDAETSVVRMRLVGAAANPVSQGADPLPGKSSYFIGNEPAKWHPNVPQFARVRYGQIYPGVDLVYYGSQGQLEYDFEVSPGADPKNIQLNFEGSKSLKLEAGDLLLETADGNVRLQAPRVYQIEGGFKKRVDGRFIFLAQDRVGFEVGAYDRRKMLVIDPVLSYSTYLGGTGSEIFPSIAVDSGFNIYVTGSTSSIDFPDAKAIPSTAATPTPPNVFVAKLDASGAALVYATYLGGAGTDASIGIAVDAAGNAYVAGTTTSTDFPTSSTAFQTTPAAAGTHAFVSELDATGATLKYSTYLSGSTTNAGTPNDTAKGMTLDNKGFVYVIGITNSTNFPTAPSAGTFQPTLQGATAFFVSKVDPSTSGANSLPFSTYFGGGIPNTGTVVGGGIAVDNNASGSNIYITGGTNYLYTGTNATTDFPIKNAFQACLNSASTVTACPSPSGAQAFDAFIAKLNPGTTTGPQLLYSTYLGGTGDDIGNGIGLDASGNAYVTGSTASSDFPKATIAQFQTAFAGGAHDAFVAKINNPITGTGTTTTNVQLTYSTYLGGNGDDLGNAIVVDGIQGARVIGTTSSADLSSKLLHPIQATLAGGTDAFVARLDTVGGGSTGTNQFLTFLGGSGDDRGTGIAIDSSTNTYVTGETASGDFPKASAFQANLSGTQDAFVAKLGPTLNLDLTVAKPASTSVNAGNQVSFVYTITNNGDTTANVAFQDNLGSGSGTAPATFVSATASGGSCPTTPTNNTVLCNLGIMNGGATATVTVNLTPTGSGTLGNSGMVFVGGSFSKNATATPVTVNTFKVGGTPPSVTVVAGQPASYQITLTPLQTYSASISLTCSAGLPGGTPAPTCTFTTTPVTLQGSSPSQVALTISTAPRTTTTARSWPEGGPFYATWLPIPGLAFLGLGLGSRVRRKGRVLGGLLFLSLMTLVLLQPACGGHSSTTTTTGTPAGTYTVTVSATSGTFSQTAPITLVVQ